MTTNESETQERTALDARDVRALTEEMTVCEHIGTARDAPGLYVVISTHEYLVDVYEGACTCPDFEHNLPTDDGRHACKHLARVTYEVGARPIPGWVTRDGICDQLLEARHVNGEPRFTDEQETDDLESDDDATPRAIADGGEDDDERPADCCCQGALPCWMCWNEGFRTPAGDGQ